MAVIPLPFGGHLNIPLSSLIPELIGVWRGIQQESAEWNKAKQCQEFGAEKPTNTQVPQRYVESSVAQTPLWKGSEI